MGHLRRRAGNGSSAGSFCPFCPESGLPLQVVATSPTVNGSPWSARAVVHPHPLYGIDGEPGRSGNGLYDKMRPVGAHEVVVENARHDRHLWNADDREIEEYLALCGQRIQDLKGDVRFKYISVFKNYGAMSGQEFDHPTSEIVATTFVPRRVLYELRSAKQHYQVKERCVSATSCGRSRNRNFASSRCVASIWPDVLMRRGSRMKPGSPRAIMRRTSSGPR